MTQETAIPLAMLTTKTRRQISQPKLTHKLLKSCTFTKIDVDYSYYNGAPFKIQIGGKLKCPSSIRSERKVVHECTNLLLTAILTEN